MRYRVVLVALLCILAGCGGASTPVSDTPESSTATQTTPTDGGDTGTTTQTATDTPTATPAPYGSAQNPITLAYRTAEDTRQARYGLFVRQMVEKYDEQGVSITGRQMHFDLVDDTSSADVVVVFTPTVKRCGSDTADATFYYCTDGDIASASENQAVVQVPTAFRNDGVQQMLNAGIAALTGIDPASEAALLYDPDSTYPYHDPWPGEGPVTVSINNSIAPDRSLVPLVRDALQYWQENQDEFGDYQVEWKLEPDNRDADIEVRFVNSIAECGDEFSDNFIGCASILEPTYLAEDQEVVRIGAGYTDESTVKLLKHEFGHLYGRTHGEDPMPIMSATQETELLPRPNVSEKPYAFESAPLEIYINYSTFSDPDSRVRAQVEHAVDYYNDHPDEYRPSSVSLSFTRDKAEAEVIIEERDLDCQSGGCSDVFYYGFDPDGDDAFESYSTMYIQLSNLDLETYGWHTGYWLSLAFQAYPRSEVFHPDTDYDGRRNWW